VALAILPGRFDGGAGGTAHSQEWLCHGRAGLKPGTTRNDVAMERGDVQMR